MGAGMERWRAILGAFVRDATRQHEQGHGEAAKLVVVVVAAVAALVLPRCAAAPPVEEVKRVLIFNTLEPLSSPAVRSCQVRNNELQEWKKHHQAAYTSKTDKGYPCSAKQKHEKLK